MASFSVPDKNANIHLAKVFVSETCENETYSYLADKIKIPYQKVVKLEHRI